MSSQTRQALDSAMQLAVQRHQAGDAGAAEALYSKVLSVEPSHPGALHNLGLIRLSRGDISGSLQLLGAAVQQRPAEPTFQFNLGLAHQTAGEFTRAAACYRQAVKLNPAYRKAWENMGVVLQEMEQQNEAIEAYRRALKLDGTSALARQNLGNALRALGRMDEAEAQYREALDQQPLNADAAVQLGATLMSGGDLSAWGWYEWRYWSAESLQAHAPWHVPLPKWDGSALAGQSLLLYGEQGVGDEIMFASCVPDVVARAAQVTLYCDPRLAQLFARSFEGVTVRGRPRGNLPLVLGPGDDAMLRCSLASLPQHFRRNATDFPGTPWLRADAAATARWRSRLAQLGGRLCIGISWRGGGAARAREARSIALERLAPWFDVPGIRFVDLQYGDHREEIARFNATAKQPLVSFDDIDPLRDMDGFASLLAALDAVITIDNSTAHLAGALGVPTWLLLPFQADWRWQRGRDDTAWYRSARLFWQRTPGSAAWTEVVARVGDALARLEPRPATGFPDITAAAPQSPGADTRKADVLLVNDTSYWYHWGCSCTSIALHEELRTTGHTVDAVAIQELNALSPLPRDAAQFDSDALFQQFCAANPALVARLASVETVVINGEGSLHDFGQTARALLYLAWIAKQRFGKHTRIVNHSCYPDTGSSRGIEALYHKVYSKLDFIAVRENRSLQKLGQLGIVATASFDCLPLFVQRHPPPRRAPGEPRVVLAGTVQREPAVVRMLADLALAAHERGYRVEILVGANAQLAQDDVLLLAELHPLLRDRYALVAATSEAQWLSTIQGADLLVSGRFHHSIAAACLGTPMLVTASNTAKNEGLLERLGLEAEQVWISPSASTRSAGRLDEMLASPQRGRVSHEALAALQALARRNFDGL